MQNTDLKIFQDKQLNIKNLKFLHFFLLIFFAGISLFLHKDKLSLDIQGAHVWRQCQTMWNINNFIRHDNNILNPRVSHFNGGKDNLYRYEFPIMQWSIAQVHRIFGENIVLTRLLLFFIGLMGAIGLYYLCALYFDDKWVASITAILFQFSPVFFYYTINPIPDLFALSASIWFLYFMLKEQETKKIRDLSLASFFLLLATLAKLPFLMFAVVNIYFFFKELLREKHFKQRQVLQILTPLIILAPALCWYAWVMPNWTDNPILTGIFKNKIAWAEYWRILSYHFVKMFPKILLYPPVWILIILGFYSFFKSRLLKGWINSLIFISFLYLILQLNAIGTSHDYYMFPFMPWLYLVIAFGVKFILDFRQKAIPWVMAALLIWAPIHTFKETKNTWGMKRTGFNIDLFEHKKALREAAPSDAKCVILNDISKFIFSYQIDKMGYVFHYDHLPAAWLDDMIRDYGVTYMYSDSRKVDENPEIRKYFEEQVLDAGSVHVYKLKSKEEVLEWRK